MSVVGINTHKRQSLLIARLGCWKNGQYFHCEHYFPCDARSFETVTSPVYFNEGLSESLCLLTFFGQTAAPCDLTEVLQGQRTQSPPSLQLPCSPAFPCDCWSFISYCVSSIHQGWVLDVSGVTCRTLTGFAFFPGVGRIWMPSPSLSIGLCWNTGALFLPLGDSPFVFLKVHRTGNTHLGNPPWASPSA